MYQLKSEFIMPFPFFPAARPQLKEVSETVNPLDSIIVADSQYTVKIASDFHQIKELLKLRYQVFNVELGDAPADVFGIEHDEFDTTSHHLTVTENSSGKIIGGYRLRTSEMNGFYSAQEFNLNDLPKEILQKSVEIGRACIDAEHRNGKVLFLLWKGLAKYLQKTERRYMFGCCSIFSRNFNDGIRAFRKLEKEGFLHEDLRVSAAKKTVAGGFVSLETDIELPKLFKTYLRIGAKVCSPPVIDADFGTIDFFVIFDSQKINPKYRKMFFEE